jgi:hypothetical protein
MDWAPTLRAALDILDGTVVPGHGAVVDRAFVAGQADEIDAAAAAASGVYANGGSVGDAAAAIGYPPRVARVVAERTFAQLNGEI